MKEAEVDYEVVEGLREITKLDPIASLKVLRARKAADNFVDLYRKYEPHDEIGADYTDANNLEYELRVKALSRKLEKSWIEYLRTENDGLGLEDYVSDYLTNYLNERNIKKGRKM